MSFIKLLDYLIIFGITKKLKNEFTSVESVGNLTWNVLEKIWNYPIKSERECRREYGFRSSIRRHISRSIVRREASSRTREPLVGPATRSNNIGSLIRNRESLSTEPSGDILVDG